jgi:esterase/lipase superfamily enzyme
MKKTAILLIQLMWLGFSANYVLHFEGCSSSKIQSPPVEDRSTGVSPSKELKTEETLSHRDSLKIDSIPTEIQVIPSEPTPYHVINLFYATDRNFTNTSKPADMYGGERADLDYGFCNLSIPQNHELGQLESPSVFKFEFKDNPERHIVLLNVNRFREENFFVTLNSIIQYAHDRRAFVFIHGYNVTFNDAARRAAQITFDLQFKGIPILYSWPSKGEEIKYPSDESNIEWTEFHLEEFLFDLVQYTSFETVFLMAHSMGNRALTKVLARILPKLENNVFKDIILIAPDIDADIFKNVIAPKLIGNASRITLYASAVDKALKASQKYHAYPRAGDSGEGLVLLKGIETIDATNINEGFIGHSYYAENRSIISDIFYLFRDGKNASDRFGLQPVDSRSGRYWIFRK